VIDLVEHSLNAEPALVQIRHSYERSLLNEAAGAGNLKIVGLLLRLGADPTAGGHSPLYCLANEFTHTSPSGRAIVHALSAAGADVNARDMKQQTTPLHMAARRGSTTIAAALLDCGAAIDPRDRDGDTPLRRAVNCNRYETARLLLKRGADVDSKGSKGFTPLTAARNAKMRTVLESI
jgi:ankyrin repeat protein